MKDELVEELRQVQQLRSLIPLLSTLTIRQILNAGEQAIDASGLNPWCINEGLADGSEQAISQWKIDAALSALDRVEALSADLERAKLAIEDALGWRQVTHIHEALRQGLKELSDDL